MKINNLDAARIPKLIEGIEITDNQNGVIFLRMGSDSFSLKGKETAIARSIFSKVDGKTSLGEILEHFEKESDKNEFFLFFQKYGSLLFGVNQNASISFLKNQRQAKIGILGTGNFSKRVKEFFEKDVNWDNQIILHSSPIDENLNSFLKEKFKEVNVLICAPKNTTYQTYNDISLACTQMNLPCIFVTIDAQEIIIGPTFIPGASACFECSRLQLFFEEEKEGKDLFRKFNSTTLAIEGTTAQIIEKAAQKIFVETQKILNLNADSPFLYLNKLESLAPSQSPQYLLKNKLFPKDDCPNCGMANKDQGTKLFSNRLVGKALIQLGLAGKRNRPASDITGPMLDSKDPKIKTIGIVGGGTAGYLTAVAFRKRFPHLRVTLIESKSIPIIGVGEATTPLLNYFLFDKLEFDIKEFYQKVRPTWKLGIRFFWGAPRDNFFHHPFGLADIFPSWYYSKSINNGSLAMKMMTNSSTPVFQLNENQHYQSILHDTPHALHLDNQLFVYFLQEKARTMGVHHKEAKIIDAKTQNEGEEIDYLITDDGQHLKFDFYIDCSGFKSLLMEKTLGSKFISYEKSLFTDTAIVGNVPHGGKIKPYTLADTMNHGWAWGIPLRDSDHRGYVFSSAFCDETTALKEMQETYPGLGEHKIVRFRSGRHQHFWKGNVAAIGNSYAFVEPLESTGIHMIIQEIISLTDYFPVLKTDHSKRILLNKRMNAHWDYLKWFLAIHFKYNKKLDTPFWKACRTETDISGVEEMVELFKEVGPLSYQNTVVQEILLPFKDDIVFGPFGFDLMLLAQGIEPNHRVKVQDDGRAWKHKQKIWNHLLHVALPQEDALRVLDKYPSLLQY